jgi:hypothetical protein
MFFLIGSRSGVHQVLLLIQVLRSWPFGRMLAPSCPATKLGQETISACVPQLTWRAREQGGGTNSFSPARREVLPKFGALPIPNLLLPVTCHLGTI